MNVIAIFLLSAIYTVFAPQRSELMKYEHACVCLQFRVMERPVSFVNESVRSRPCARLCSQRCATTSTSIFASASSSRRPATASLLRPSPSISLPSLLMECFYLPFMSAAIIHSKRLNYPDGKWPGMHGGGKRGGRATPLRILEWGEKE